MKTENFVIASKLNLQNMPETQHLNLSGLRRKVVQAPAHTILARKQQSLTV